MLKLDLEKAEEPEIKLPASVGSLKKQKNSRRVYFYFTDYAKAFNYVVTTNCGKFLKKFGHYFASM